MARPLRIQINGLEVVITAQPLTREEFAPFGDVIENPSPSTHPLTLASSSVISHIDSDQVTRSPALPFDAVTANQGTAIKYRHVSRPINLYNQAPSCRPGVASMNLFACAARTLTPSLSPHHDSNSSSSPSSSSDNHHHYHPPPIGIFSVTMLERHPFTSQTFTPLTLDPRASYLIIVAPDRPPTVGDPALVLPSPARRYGRGGLPDLRRLRAFVATPRQAVTYAPGTWHAPMVVLDAGGERRDSGGDGDGRTLDFLVVQFANGVAGEDVQEVMLVSEGGEKRRGSVLVRVPARGRVAKL